MDERTMEREDLYEPLQWKNDVGRTMKARKNKVKPKNHAVVVQVP